MTHPSRNLDELVHQRVRLGILAVLREADSADFSYLRDTLDVTDGNLSRHLAVLSEAGLVSIHKGYRGRRPHTEIRATRQGRRAFDGHVETLRALIDSSEGSRT